MAKEREYHQDGSYTDRYDDYQNTSATYNSDGSARETSTDESHIPFGLGCDNTIRVTRDGDGNVVNIQNLK